MRTISEPARASAATCAVVPAISAVSVLVIDCTTTGAPPPTSTPPTSTPTDCLRIAGPAIRHLKNSSREIGRPACRRNVSARWRTDAGGPKNVIDPLLIAWGAIPFITHVQHPPPPHRPFPQRSPSALEGTACARDPALPQGRDAVRRVLPDQ